MREAAGAWPFLSYLVNRPPAKMTGARFLTRLSRASTGKMMEFMQHGERRTPMPVAMRNAAGDGAPAADHALNEWAGPIFRPSIGERVTLDYYVWLPEGKLADALG